VHYLSFDIQLRIGGFIFVFIFYHTLRTRAEKILQSKNVQNEGIFFGSRYDVDCFQCGIKEREIKRKDCL